MTSPETLKPDELVLTERLRNLTDLLDRRSLWDQAAACTEAADRIIALQAALEKINAIRNSIIGFQSVNWSAHIYPLVAALQEVGFEGEGYEIAREKAQSFVERVNAAEARATTAEAALVKARTALLVEVISLIEDDMYGPGEAEDVPERMAFNKALRRQINRITSRLIVFPALSGEEENVR